MVPEVGDGRGAVALRYARPMAVSGGPPMAQRLAALRRRADEDFVSPADEPVRGRHQVDIAELGMRVSLTRSRYPNGPTGVDQYAVTISRQDLDHPPAQPEVEAILEAAFGGEQARAAQERPSGSLVRMFRVPADPAR
jgi:hypothetical protein